MAEINIEISTPLSMNIGIPQGSILGLHLFIIYINNIFYLTSTTEEKLFLYADDATFMLSQDQSDEAITITKIFITKVHNWFSANRPKLDSSKIKFLFSEKALTSLL